MTIKQELPKAFGSAEPSNSKRYVLTVEVDVDALVAAYTGGDTSFSPEQSERAIQRYDLPAIDELILFECGFVSASGIHVKQIEEIEE